MGAVITRLRRGRKKEQNPKNKKKKGKVVVVKRGSITPSSSRSVRGSIRPRRSNGAQRSQNRQRKLLTEASTNTDTDKTSHVYMVIDDNGQPANLGGTQANDTQRSKQRSTKRRKSNGTKCSQKGHTVERRPLNDIFPKRGEDATDGGKIGDNNIQRSGSKLRDSKRSAKGSLRRRKSSRKLKKHLFPSPAVFSQIDAHAIKAGEELRRKRIFSVKAIIEAITVGAVTDLQKLRAIWIWLCHNIEYDVNGYLGMTEMITSIEQVVETRRGVCSGYARLCEQMCSEVGIECRKVSGHSKGASYRPGLHAEPTKSNHAWNAVRLQGNWYLLDSCWGAGTVDLTKRVFNKCYNEFYFLTDPDMFISDHFPDEVEWQLLKEPLSLEEFRMRVQKYSQFFQLGLTLHHPTHFLLITENGEATVSMTFPEPLEFSYQICQRSDSIQRELSTSAALLTVTTTHMKLRLRPPTQGTFDVIVFARTANTSGKLQCVCNFLLECPKPSPLDSFPENPSKSWGLNQNATSMGLKPCQYQAEIMLESATFEMVLQTSRPLMMLCELFHKDLDEALAKRCVATQSEPDQLSCHVLCPYVGYYRLTVFVKDCDSTGNSYSPVGMFLLHCTSSAVININKLFPPGLSSNCGPGNGTLKAGLADFSHTRAIINTQQGQCSITFRNQHSLKLQADLCRQERPQPKYPLSRYVLLSCDEKDVTISVALPGAGVYRLSLFGGPATSALSHICDYVLWNDWDGAWPPFPQSYSTWNDGCVLFEPRTGHLEPMSKVRFCVKIPRAIKVNVIGQDHTELHINQKSQMWEGEVHTSTVPQLKLAASFPGGAPRELNILLCFDVLRTPNGMR
ncbi:kyphoscoliosis peptidase-like isoform X1 [Alosa sapidissima]|uniref:kyphoscoliosis peptidase-like isoform X1 n=2 Tax=Alosa sapidissima TaxID=34773 RepID=UPI001C090758|nr:kyphoscoliosis peptidase-like isoform X1 [Alosa sapidissima]XP_041934194.1 kyphoscoliosis peptidase-like isoform X1 [Alosa sapidissima]